LPYNVPIIIPAQLFENILERRPAMDIIKVSGNSRTSAVAGAIAGVFREHRRAEVQAIGAGAVNQAVKALVLAKGYLAEDGLDVAFIPEFVDVEIDEKTRTAVRMVVLPFSASGGAEDAGDQAILQETPTLNEETPPTEPYEPFEPEG
jgi:stage V sporulation protein S